MRLFFKKRLLFCLFVVTPILAEGHPKCPRFGSPTIGSKEALIISNGDYEGGVPDLDDAEPNLKAMKFALIRDGFSGYACRDLENAEINNVISDLFGRDNAVSRWSNSVVLYFSGHGGSMEGKNFLFGVDVKSLENPVRPYALDTALNLLADSSYAGHRTNVVLIDACRSPFKGPVVEGPTMLPVVARPSTFLGFATQPGGGARPGTGEEPSPFTQALSKYLTTDTNLDEAFMLVRSSVLAKTGDLQNPWAAHDLVFPFSLANGVRNFGGMLSDEDFENLLAESTLKAYCEGARQIYDDFSEKFSANELPLGIAINDLDRLQTCVVDESGALNRLLVEIDSGTYQRVSVSSREADRALPYEGFRFGDDPTCDPLGDYKACSVDILLLKTAAERKGWVGNGRLAWLHMHRGLKGHFEITDEVLKSQGRDFGPRTRFLVADASQDPDFYDWSDPAAHGQSKCGPDGALESGDFRANQKAWIQKHLGRFKTEVSAGNPQLGLYFLGYALHSIQDLVFHAGMSNAEHSYWDYVAEVPVDLGPDLEAKLDAANLATDYALMRIGEIAGIHWDQLAECNEFRPLSLWPPDKVHLLQPWKRMMTPGKLRDFLKEGEPLRDKPVTDHRYFLEPKWLDIQQPASVMTAVDWLLEGF